MNSNDLQRAQYLLSKGNLTSTDLAEAEAITRRAVLREGGPVTATAGAGSTLVDHLMATAPWREFRSTVAAQGYVPETSGVNIAPVQVPTRMLLGQKAIDASNLVSPEFVLPSQGVTPARIPLNLASLLTVAECSTDLVYYAAESSYTSNAAPQVNQGDTKPESELTYTRNSAPVVTVAHYATVARQALADVNQLQAILEQYLLWGVRNKLEDLLLNGSGAAPDVFTGILQTAGIETVGPVSGDVAGIEALRKGLTAVRVQGLSEPTAVLLNPADSEALDLARDSVGRFFGQGPFSSGPASVWSLPQVNSWHIPQGTALVGDFKSAILFMRDQGTVAVSDSHGTYFVQNLCAVLGEIRCAFAVPRPQAFCRVTLA